MERSVAERRERNRWTAGELTVMGLMAALLSASSYITIPLPFSEAGITAQTIMVNMIGMLLGPAQTAAVFAVWILLGLAGLPVFSGGLGGPAKLFGPTGGYIFGFLAAAVLISLFSQRKKGIRAETAFAAVVGIPVIYLFGVAWTRILTGLPWSALMARYVLPFIPLDIVKCLAAAALAKALRPVLP